jgi:hypothetical protein
MSDPHARLMRDLLALTDGMAAVRHASCTPWASVTFAGVRHRIDLTMPAGAAKWLTERIAGIEFAIPGHVVADIAVEAARAANDLIELDISALTIEEG